jgi:hypothetical protein
VNALSTGGSGPDSLSQIASSARTSSKPGSQHCLSVRASVSICAAGELAGDGRWRPEAVRLWLCARPPGGWAASRHEQLCHHALVPSTRCGWRLYLCHMGASEQCCTNCGGREWLGLTLVRPSLHGASVAMQRWWSERTTERLLTSGRWVRGPGCTACRTNALCCATPGSCAAQLPPPSGGRGFLAQLERLPCHAGCLFAELLNGQPLFPGASNMDQLALIVACFGHLPNRLLAKALTNPHLVGVQLRTGNPRNWAVALQQRCGRRCAPACPARSHVQPGAQPPPTRQGG